MPQHAQVLSAEELFAMPDVMTRYELVQGELRTISPAGGRHAGGMQFPVISGTSQISLPEGTGKGLFLPLEMDLRASEKDRVPRREHGSARPQDAAEIPPRKKGS
jgi:hypothetical protein